MTSPMRFHSSSGVTGVAPGRVDSPPTSTMAAPARTMSSPCSTAASGSRYAPPSEKESGVTFKIPMMRGVLVSKSYCPQCQIMNAEASSFSAFPPFDS